MFYVWERSLGGGEWSLLTLLYSRQELNSFFEANYNVISEFTITHGNTPPISKRVS